MTIIGKCVAALTIAALQINGAQSADELVNPVATTQGFAANAENLFPLLLESADKLLKLFVDPANPKKILTQALFPARNGPRACIAMAAANDQYYFMMARADSEVDRANSADVELYEMLDEQRKEMKIISHTFCGFTPETFGVEVGKPTEDLVVRLVKVRNVLRRAQVQKFGLRDKSRQWTPRYWVDLGLQSLEIIRGHLELPDGTLRTKYQSDTSPLQLCYHLGHTMLISSAIGVTRFQENQDNNLRPEDPVCRDMVDALKTQTYETANGFCNGTPQGLGITEGQISKEMDLAVGVAKSMMNDVRARCSK